MKVAFAVWRQRIAPLFDSTGNCLVGETQGYGKPVEHLVFVKLPHESCREKSRLLVEMGAQAIVCGAISMQCEVQLLQQGIEVFAFLAGDVDEVVDAWTHGRLHDQRFWMPGCRCPHRRCRRHGRSGNMGVHGNQMP
jgi:predicted Fe-Mo cluster-binding NifX family protein